MLALRLRQAARILQTLRYLRGRQLIYQARARFGRQLRTKSQRAATKPQLIPLRVPVARPESYLGRGRFRFLNRSADLGDQIDWSARGFPMLWQYNLHYFDYLQQPTIAPETATQLMDDWIRSNPPDPRSVGWHPYPTCLRMVNWIKFTSRCGEASPRVCESLLLQTENLALQIEYHLLGNHLFANGKALWFAGVFLNQADWTARGRKIVLRELGAQFLEDGGHFELSPMYHAIAVEDLLDLINLANATGDQDAVAKLRDVTAQALGWFDGMLHPNGELPLLNDAAGGIAAPSAELIAYAERLNVSARCAAPQQEFDAGWRGCNYSGYWVLTNGVLRLVFDTALLGPDYLPGHAHCDMLSVLLDLHRQPILTDTGVFEYNETARRTYSRSTSAHNTVQLDRLEQGDIWKSFRMGKRGHPAGLTVSRSEISCEHTGFSIWRSGLRHRRSLRFRSGGFDVVDHLEGPATHEFTARYHFAPGLDIALLPNGTVTVNPALSFQVAGGEATVARTERYPEFGVIQERSSLIVSGRFERSHELRLSCTYSS